MHEQRLCTWHELSTIYSLEDVHLFHVALDVADELTSKAAAEARKRAEAKKP